MADVGPVSSFTARSPVVLSTDRLYIDDGAGADWSLSLAVLMASLTKVNNVTVTKPATGSTLTIADGKTLTANNTLTLAGTDGKTLTISNSLTLAGTDATTMTFPSTSATIARTDAAQTFTGVQTFSTPIATGSVATMTATVGGGVPTPPNNTTTFLRGDGTFATPASGAGLGANTFTDTQTIAQATATHSLLVSTGGSNTGSDATSAIDLSWTLNTTGSPNVFALRITDTARGAATKLFNIFSGASGTTSAFSIDRTGNTIINGASLASTPSLLVSGTTFSGGNSTTTKPQLLIETTGATSNNWFSGGTKLGINLNATDIANSVNIIDCQNNGSANFSVSASGNCTISGNVTATAGILSNIILGNSNDIFIRRIGPANLRFGNASNATPVANLLTIGESSRGGTDSNVGGANGTVQSGLGTGTGTLSTLILQSPKAAASGTTAQTYATGLVVNAGTAVLTSYIVANLPAAATAGAGATAFVTDASTTLVLGLGGAVSGGGTNKVPVFSDGTNWNYG